MGEFCVWLAKMEIEENYFPLQIRKCGLGVEAIARVVTKKRNVRQLCFRHYSVASVEARVLG